VTSVVVTPSAREAFTPRELTDAYNEFKERGPQYLCGESILRAAAYQFGTRVLLVDEESETGVVVLTHPTSLEGASCVEKLSEKSRRRVVWPYRLPCRPFRPALPSS
jgi:hypothetical protein